MPYSLKSLAALALLVVSASLATAADVPQVPAGFVASLYAREPVVRNPCSVAFDARGRMFVGMGPQYRMPKPETPGDSVVIVLDRDGDGTADATHTFATGLNCIQGLAWRGRDLWVANAPDLTIVRDLNGDDRADEYVRVYTDLGNIEHALHGLSFAPDGKLYMSKGNSKGLNRPDRYAPKPFRDLWGLQAPAGAVDHPPPQTFKAADYRKAYQDPADDWGRSGGVLRCDEMGANLEIVSRGFRNPWDIAFDSGFHWLGTDNDQSDGDRLFMPFYGADFGWSHAWSSHWTGENHPPTAPISGPVFPGSGTGIVWCDLPHFPAEYRGVFFINDWLLKRTMLYRPRWAGALMQPEGEWQEFVTGKGVLFNPTDLEIGPDGALYCLGWGTSYGANLGPKGEMQNEGRVWRIAWKDAPAREWDTPKRKRPIGEWSTAELIDDLGAHLPVWQINAQDEMVRRGGDVKQELIAALADAKRSERAETWLAWTLGRLGRDDAAVDAWLARTLAARETSLNLRIQAIRIWAFRARRPGPAKALLPTILALLVVSEPRLRFEAMQALAQVRPADLSLAAVKNVAADETDRLTFYAAWHLFRDIASASELREMLADSRPGIRRAALLALADRKEMTSELARQHESDPETAEIAALILGKRPPRAAAKPSGTAAAPARPVSAAERLFGAPAIRFDGAMQPQLSTSPFEPGIEIYHDRTFTLLQRPDELTDAVLVQTANDSSGVGGGEALRFESLLPMRVLVAHDNRIAKRPPWLAGWAKMELAARTSDATFTLFEKAFPPGPVVLGGNTEDGTGSGKSSYFVLLLPRIPTPARPASIEEALAAVPKGNADRGRAIFFAAGGANCSACHRIAGRGGEFGPDLTKLGQRGEPAALVRSLLVPSEIITEGFAPLRVSLLDGRTFTGLLREETDRHLMLAQSHGEPLRIEKELIEERQPTRVSPMPAYDRILSSEHVADLVAFLVQIQAAVPPPAGNDTPPPPATKPNSPREPAPPQLGPLANTSRSFHLATEPGRMTIAFDGRRVGDYVFADAKVLRPHFQNMRAPDGTQVTRNHPPIGGKDAEDHAEMHPGIWLAFGDVGGEDFWRNRGTIRHDRFAMLPKIHDGTLTWATDNTLVAKDGRELARQRSSFTLAARPRHYVLTWEAEFKPLIEKLSFGDQEEMGLGARVATPLTEKAGGTITSSTGDRTAATTWGKVYPWCDYSGVVTTMDAEGKKTERRAGITIMPDPGNDRPSWWHNRDYGVFVANPFGQRSLPGGPARVELKHGETLKLRFAVLLHSSPVGEPLDLKAAVKALP